MSKQKKLIVCDVEGTIFKANYQIDGVDYASTIWQPLARALGKEAVLTEQELAKKWEKGEFEYYLDWVDATFEMHKKLGLEKTVFKRLVSNAEYVDGVKEFFASLDRDQYIPVLISGGFQELVDRAMKELKIDYGIGACTYIFDNKGKLSARKLFPSDFTGKSDYVEMHIKQFGLNLYSDWVFIGDGKNDKFIAEIAPIAFAIHGHEELKEIDGIYKVDNFFEVNELVNKLTDKDYKEKFKNRYKKSDELYVIGRFHGYFYVATNLLQEWLHNNVSEKTKDLLEGNLKINRTIENADLSGLMDSMISLDRNGYKIISTRGILYKTREVRNNWSHLSPNKFPSPKNIINDLQTMKKFMSQVGGEKATDTIKDIDKWIKELSAGN